jgi:hypothetical protein
MTTLCIFDAYGKIRSDLDTEQATIEALPDDQRETLFVCISTVTARGDCENRVIAARADVRKKEVIYNEAVMAFDQTAPSDNMHAEAKRNPKHAYEKDAQRIANIRAVSAAQQPGYFSPKIVKNKLKSAMDAANVALTDARAELTRATGELKVLEARCGEAINRWRMVQSTPSAEEVTRAYIASGQAERMRRVANGESAEPVKAASPNISELDKVLGARGKTATNRTPTYHGPR